MSADEITIEINGVEVKARAGQMLIEVTDAADAYVPRFCYHEKLSIAANCRMCLVEVENAPKPLPACATPVTDGMKVLTRSADAIAAQKATMEFLLINHPLDCPICDQGGECELQDLAMGFGRGVSRYSEGKRVVKDKDLGPLVSTDMTRCIHCTRCVRFGEEIAGIQELGTIGRGERTEISTYIETSVDHELSGNIIDLCPVGALNNKPYRFSARAWEMSAHASISPHDCYGSNLSLHVLDGRVQRVVPAPNENLNETWLADRDRFGCEGLYADDRAAMPMRREDGELRACSWDQALEAAAAGLQATGEALATLVSPSATVEEGYLAARLTRHLGSASIDHRLRRRDFREQDSDPLFPWLGMPIAAVSDCDAVCIVGANLRAEVPLLAHRVRTAAVNGAPVSFVNPVSYEYFFPVSSYFVADDLVAGLAALVKAGLGRHKPATAIAPMLKAADGPDVTQAHRDTIGALRDAPSGLVLLGQISMRHPRFAELRRLAAELARLTDTTLGYLPEGANSAGLCLAGVLPHRDAGGHAAEHAGTNAGEILAMPPRGLLLLGVEPEADLADPGLARQMLARSDFTIALTSYLAEELAAHADVVLPIAGFAETAGTYVNVAGDWQSFRPAAAPVGESRPGWKVLRVLGNRLGLPDCDYDQVEDICAELRGRLGDLPPGNEFTGSGPLAAASEAMPALDALDVNMYRIDALVRRAQPLQATQIARAAAGPATRRRLA